MVEGQFKKKKGGDYDQKKPKMFLRRQKQKMSPRPLNTWE